MNFEVPDGVLDELAERVAAKIAERLVPAESGTPWMTMREAIEYSRVPAGTWRKWVAEGRIPSHGGRRRLFHRVEVDAALGYRAVSSVETTGGGLRAA